MQHNFVVEGCAYRLRPVSDNDAGFIIKLRSDPELNRFLHLTSPSIEAQLEWLTNYYSRPGDWYFVLERRYDSTAEGLISLYGFDTYEGSAEWGRWILRKDSMAAVESAMLIYRFAFEELCMREVYCRTAAENQSVVSFHDSCGIAERRVLSNHFNLNGRKLDAVEHRVRRTEWKMMEARLEPLAQRISRRLKLDT
jgi:RimJ/RimL family protein N-acetyltransferase